jgi:hypothetical protein
MKNKYSFSFRSALASLVTVDKIIATFGQARLVRLANGRHTLRGGTPTEQAEAREWCAMFAPEVVFDSVVRHPAILVFTE